MNIPDEALQTFKQAAEEAVKAFREISGRPEPKTHSLIDAVWKHYLEYVRHMVEHIAQEEFKRLGREHVRKIVLETFDRFIGEQQ